MLTRLKSKIKTLARTILVTENWIVAPFKYFFLKKDVRIRFRNGYELLIRQGEWARFNSFSSFFRHFPQGKIDGTVATLVYQSRRILFDFDNRAPGVISEFFGKNFPYKVHFDVSRIRNRVVVDIGAYLGDSTVWFAVHGAKKVYAFEPLTSYYDLCKRNIELNDLVSICEVKQAAVGGDAGKDFFEIESSRQALALGKGIRDEYKKNVPVFTLKDIVRMYAIKSGAFLKIDCEGYEYDIILETDNEILKLFDFVMMEYHYGYERLKNKLEEAGFLMQYTKPEYGYQASGGKGYQEMSIGYIFAKR